MYNFEKLSPAAKLWHFYHKIATLHRPVMILLSLQTFWRPQNWVKPSLSLSQKLPFSQQHVLINLKPLIILVVKKVNMMILLKRVVAILTCLFFTLNWLTLTLRHICTILPHGYFFSPGAKISMWHWGWGCYKKYLNAYPLMSNRGYSQNFQNLNFLHIFIALL